MKPILDALEERVLVCDGAMGTMLYAKGVFINKSFDALNVTQPDLVAEVHQEYVRAGADIVETNTFGANRIKLGSFGLADKLHAINEQGARIARHAAREQAYVAGAIGPLGIRIEPWGKTGVDEAREYFREQAAALAAGGVDLFILETFRDLNEIGAAIDAVRMVSDKPIVAQTTPEHIRQMKTAVRGLVTGGTGAANHLRQGSGGQEAAPYITQNVGHRFSGAAGSTADATSAPIERAQKSRLAQALAGGQFVRA